MCVEEDSRQDVIGRTHGGGCRTRLTLLRSMKSGACAASCNYLARAFVTVIDMELCMGFLHIMCNTGDETTKHAAEEEQAHYYNKVYRRDSPAYIPF